MRNIQSTLMYPWFQEVWNKGNRNNIDDLLDDDVIIHGLSATGTVTGKDAFKEFYDGFKSEYKDINVVLEDVFQEDDVEIARCLVNAKHTASGAPVAFTGICIARFKDGKIAEAWNEYNFLAMYMQVGFTLAEPVTA